MTNPTADSPRTSSGLLVIGYGNTLREDDGVGPKVADAVAALNLPNVRTIACDLLTPELSDPISQANFVVFVDAAVDASREVELRPLEVATSSQIMAHAADPRTMLAVARDVFGHAPKSWLLTVPAERMGIGEAFSVVTRKGFSQAVEMIRKLANDRLGSADFC